jgi:hypothetical protein
VELFFVVGEEAVGLVASVILGAETPVNIREDCLFFEVDCTEYTAAYSLVPLNVIDKVEKKRAYQLLVHFWLKTMVIFT